MCSELARWFQARGNLTRLADAWHHGKFIFIKICQHDTGSRQVVHLLKCGDYAQSDSTDPVLDASRCLALLEQFREEFCHRIGGIDEAKVSVCSSCFELLHTVIYYRFCGFLLDC